MSVYGYVLERADGSIRMLGQGDPGTGLSTLERAQMRTFASAEEMEKDPAVRLFRHGRSVRRALEENDGLISEAAYAVKYAQAIRWLAEHPLEDGWPPDPDRFGYVIDDCEIESLSGPANPWVCARAIVAAHEADTRATEKARRLRKKQLSLIEGQDGS